MARPIGLTLLLLSVASASGAQVPAGPEFRVNAYTTGFQRVVTAAGLAGGETLFVVNSFALDADGQAVGANRFGPSGARLGAEFVVNTYTTGSQLASFSLAAAGGSRGFVVTFTSDGEDGSLGGAAVERFAANGARLGPLMANSYTTGDQFSPQVAFAADGSFVVVWNDAAGGAPFDVFGQRFDANGNRLGSEFQANTYTTGDQSSAKVFGDEAGRFTVIWRGADGSGSGVVGRRFDASGAPVGNEFVVNTYTTGSQRSYGGAMNRNGELVVVWRGPDGDGYGVFARRYDPDGAPLGPEFRVNSATTGMQGLGTAAMDDRGNFVVAWFSDSPGDGGSGTNGTLAAFGQRFTAAGVRRGAEFRANTYTTGDQGTTVVASDDVGNFVVAWTSGASSGGQDGSLSGAFAQRFGGLRPAALSVTDGGNGVLEVPEDFALITSWRNISGASQTFQGRSSDAVAPSGLILTLGPDADYGTVADGAVGACAGPCFSGALLGTRPPGHVDLGFLESLEPDTQGQQKRWRVHVGDSFGDVPRSNLFYRYIETLLHHEVTGGCGPNLYCPANPTTREGMAVFVLVAKEGAGYGPPACTTPVFSDVPAGSPFCPWIEELARRGVVSGCAPGRYCPANAVTREQMAVFVLRTLDPVLDPPACTSPVFADVPAASPFCRWIEELVRRGVVSGCAAGLYCPTQAVTREQMGVFISLTFGLALYGP